MLKRKIYDELLLWKENRRRKEIKKCLLIKGARQVGKSYIVKEFGKKEYESFINIDFYRQKHLKAIFEGDLTSDEIYKRMTANISNIRLIPGRTLIFLDEIQCCGSARTALKFLAEDLKYDVIASGSLLGLSYGQDDDEEVEEPASLPVGYEIQLNMYSLDFEEFLWANGYGEEVLQSIREYIIKEKVIPESIHNHLEQLFREYMVVGGMPEVVSDFAEKKDFGSVMDIQENIVSLYQDDISKHAKGREKQLVRMCYDSVPKQLSRERKKFQYSAVEKGQTRRKFGGSIQWLKDSNLVNVCYNVSEPYLPLMANAKEEQFKLYINDTGLLSCMYGFETKRAILNGTIMGNAKGAVYENVIAELLTKKGYSLYYYRPDDDHELEFLMESDGGVIPIEVKAGNNASVTLNSFIQEFHPSRAYKLIAGRNGNSEGKVTLPHYCVMLL